MLTAYLLKYLLFLLVVPDKYTWQFFFSSHQSFVGFFSVFEKSKRKNLNPMTYVWAAKIMRMHREIAALSQGHIFLHGNVF